MTQRQILDLVGQGGSSLELECLSVKYTFHFNCNPQLANDQTVFEVGRNDVGIPIVVDPNVGNIYFWNAGKLSFINSSFNQMLEAFRLINEWGIPDDLPDAARTGLFTSRMLENDPNCFCNPEACWSMVREEMGYGVI